MSNSHACHRFYPFVLGCLTLENRYILSLHGFTAYLRVTFLRGAHLTPLPPGPSKDPDTRYLDLRETDPLDEDQFADWVRQSARIPGWIP